MAGRAGRVCRALRAAQQPPLVRTMHPWEGKDTSRIPRWPRQRCGTVGGGGGKCGMKLLPVTASGRIYIARGGAMVVKGGHIRSDTGME